MYQNKVYKKLSFIDFSSSSHRIPADPGPRGRRVPAGVVLAAHAGAHADCCSARALHRPEGCVAEPATEADVSTLP